MSLVKFVGPKPIISDKGVRFDASQPDKYIYLGAALQLAQAFDVRGEAHDIVYRAKSGELSETQINDLLPKYCKDPQARVEAREEEARSLVAELKAKIQSASTLSEEARRAWLNNIDAMYDYYLQYVTNEAVYECVLDTIAQEVVDAHIREIKVPMLNHFGMVLHDLADRLEQRRPPVDSELHVEHTPEGLFAIMKLRHA